MEIFRMLLAYFGPETMLPLTSILAAAGGFFLVFGRNTLRIASVIFGKLRSLLGRQPQPASRQPIQRPHVMSRERYAANQMDNNAEEVTS